MIGKVGSDNQNSSFFNFQVKGSEKADQGKGAKSINASGFSDALDPNARLKKAKNQAMKFIRDALSGEVSIDDDLKKRNDHIKELAATVNESRGRLDSINKELDMLHEEYGIEPGGKEDQELEFLVQADKARAASPTGQLSHEMQERVDKLMAGLSEYQQKALPDMLERESLTGILEDAESELLVEGMTVRETKLERLKSDPMGDAWDNADSLVDAAEKELVSSLYAEAKDNIEKDLEEKAEDAKDAAEKREELEEKLEEAKEKKKEEEKVTEEILEAVQEKNISSLDMSDPGSEINELMNKLKLIEYDVKGAAVDEKL